MNTESFCKRRVAEVRSLKDQLYTATGLQQLNARLTLADPEIQAEFRDEREMIEKMINNTKQKNKVDQTWPILSTPGFSNTVGIENIYISDTHRIFTPPKVLYPVKIIAKVKPK